jgi:hypothetical protein
MIKHLYQHICEKIDITNMSQCERLYTFSLPSYVCDDLSDYAPPIPSLFTYTPDLLSFHMYFDAVMCCLSFYHIIFICTLIRSCVVCLSIIPYVFILLIPHTLSKDYIRAEESAVGARFSTLK